VGEHHGLTIRHATSWQGTSQDRISGPERAPDCEFVCISFIRDVILREFPSYQSIRKEFLFVAPVASATGTIVGTHTRRSTHAPTYICMM